MIRFVVLVLSVGLIFASRGQLVALGIRDEAHRFAITYHRKLRDAPSMAAERVRRRRRGLDGIPGSLFNVRFLN